MTRQSLHDGWTPEPQEQVQPGDPWRDPKPLWTPPELTLADHAFIGLVVQFGQCWVHPDTMLEVRGRLAAYARFKEPLPEQSPINDGVRINVDDSFAAGRVYGPAGSSMALDTFIPSITPAER